RTRGQAAAALGRFGPGAKEAVPALIALLKDKDPFVRVQATDTLAKIGPDALPALEAALTPDSDTLTGMGGALTLGHMGAAAKPVTAALVAKLRDPDVEERCHAAQALWRIDGRTSETVPVLAAALKAEDKNVRLGAVGILSRMGPAAAQAVPAVKSA